MKKFYGVVQYYYANDVIKLKCIEFVGALMPLNTYSVKKDCDVMCDWFDDILRADLFCSDVLDCKSLFYDYLLVRKIL